MSGKVPTALQVRTLRHHLVHGSKGAAAELGVAFQTVRNNLGTLYAKLGVNGDVEAARVLGWLRIPADDDIAVLDLFDIASRELRADIAAAEAVLADLERLRSAGPASVSAVESRGARHDPTGAPESSDCRCDFPERMGGVHRLGCPRAVG